MKALPREAQTFPKVLEKLRSRNTRGSGTPHMPLLSDLIPLFGWGAPEQTGNPWAGQCKEKCILVIHQVLEVSEEFPNVKISSE